MSELPEGKRARMQGGQGRKGPEARLIKLWTNPIAAVEIASAVRFMIRLGRRPRISPAWRNWAFLIAGLEESLHADAQVLGCQ